MDDRRVHLHLHLSAEARRALRLAAAHRGVSMADLVALWAERGARSLGLLADPPKVPDRT